VTRRKAVIPRALANQDVDATIDYYLTEAGEQAAAGFIEALESAYAHVSRYPATGSARYAHELELPGLRCWPLKRYPHLVFYVDRIDHVDVLRVLHGQIDIPAWMREPEEQRG
jgi:toxin ParE1/3/4